MNGWPADERKSASPADSATIARLVEDVVRSATREEPAELNAILLVAYDEMRLLAAYLLRGETAARTLQPTALAHEAYLRLARETRSHLQGREHLLASRPP